VCILIGIPKEHCHFILFCLYVHSAGPALTRLDCNKLIDAAGLDADEFLPAAIFRLVDGLSRVPGRERV
jgi:hypothetical protein